jgi:hypothetical protein
MRDEVWQIGEAGKAVVSFLGWCTRCFLCADFAVFLFKPVRS